MRRAYTEILSNALEGSIILKPSIQKYCRIIALFIRGIEATFLRIFVIIFFEDT